MPAPFWEDDYSDDSAEPFGTAAGEVVDLGRRLGGGIALDAGCGDGRNALALASAGLQVDAFDLSGAGIAKLKRRAAAAGLTINATVDDLRDFEPARAYDLVVCHGVLHFLQPADASRALIRLQAATRPGGWNVVTVFTTRVPVPADLLKLTPGVFAEGDLVARYRGWAVERAEAYVFQDEHRGGLHHTHSVEKVLARRTSLLGRNPDTSTWR